MEQFSQNDGGYILVLVLNTLYIFENSKIFMKSFDISDKINVDNNYNYIIPYKKDDSNYLHFVISNA